MNLRRFFCALLLAALPACSALAPANFASGEPRFEPEKFFTGHIKSWGVIETRNGDPSSRFTTEIDGRMDGDDLILDQSFAFDDGRTQTRTWRLRRLDAHRYEGTANDVIGIATGEAHGNAFRFEYTLALDPGNPLKNVHMRQWMYGLGEGSMMMNRVDVTKLGVTVAQVTEFFTKSERR
jgi:hypothetical protein